ncbi:MAG TPA: hypothetical protein VFD03_06450 [Clostridia bacterium]|nr:hypothetical protein [Clostridia bacterium]
MNKLRLITQKYKKYLWVIVLVYIAYHGCFTFPFSNVLFPFDFSKALLVIYGYGIIGMCYFGLLEKGRVFTVFGLTLVFTIIGLTYRYFIEFGEVSNSMNFIPINIILYLAVVPMYCTLVYWAIWKWYAKKIV